MAIPDPKPDDVDFHEETDSPSYADDRNFYKVEKWTRDGRSVFERAIKYRPRIRLTLRQRTRQLDQWPPPRGT